MGPYWAIDEKRNNGSVLPNLSIGNMQLWVTFALFGQVRNRQFGSTSEPDDAHTHEPKTSLSFLSSSLIISFLFLKKAWRCAPFGAIPAFSPLFLCLLLGFLIPQLQKIFEVVEVLENLRTGRTNNRCMKAGEEEGMVPMSESCAANPNLNTKWGSSSSF